MATMVVDKELWHQHWMDTPLSPPGGRTADEAAKKPGNAVKSIEREGYGQMPKHHGRLSQYDVEGQCIVIGHNSPISDTFVWKGTTKEYHCTWVVD